MDAITDVPMPANEPVHEYAPRQPRARPPGRRAGRRCAADPIDLPHVIGGAARGWAAATASTSCSRTGTPRVLGTLTNADHAEAIAAVDAAIAAKAQWAATPFDERAAVFLRAADLLAGPWREKIAAATMLGQSKTAYQAEIDASCELVDFWRFNVAFARQILAAAADQRPRRVEPHRLPPARGLRLRDHPVQLHRDRGQPADRTRADGQHRGVETVCHADVLGVPDHAAARGGGPAARRHQPASPATGSRCPTCVLADPRLAGIHFTGSTATFQHLWREVGSQHRPLPTPTRGWSARPAARTSCVAHASARPDVLRTALIRGAFDYQGQKCSAASRAFVPRSVWQRMGDDFLERHRGARLRRRHRPVELRRRADRRAGVRQERRGHRARQGRRRA